jgi:hypothetical protein
MESKLLPSPVNDSPAETGCPEQQSGPGTSALAEVREAIKADCLLVPKEYLEEVRVAASGE